ncbi:MAG: hypothetical protein ISS19_01615 [Bacteroidales bacterium]|nr:hypothetical protein [Bacteroidales bacterium]
MPTKEQIEKAVIGQIEKYEKLGEQAGGSGHLSDVNFIIDEIGDPVETGEGWEVEYKYTAVITSEFTIEPDNPPYRYPKSGKVILEKKNL